MGNPKMLKMPDIEDTCQEELQTGCEISPRNRSVLQSTNVNGVGDLKITLTSDVEMQSMEFVLLIFCIA